MDIGKVVEFRTANTFTDSLARLIGNRPSSGRIAVKVINHLGDEVMKVFKVV